jgi:NADH-quinone oxidoreductase subunit C
MAIEIVDIQNKVSEKFGESVTNYRMQRDIFCFDVEANEVHSLIQFLKEDSDLNFHFLTDIAGIHYPENDENHQFALTYQLHNWIENTRIRIKTYLNGNNPEIKTITDLFLCSNWMEREAWDFYGIKFEGHPQLKRILNMDEMVSHPMRKEFPLEDSGRTDKDDRFFGRTPINS